MLPQLAVTDGQVLASKCDGAILVVSSGKTETENAVKAKELLESANSHIIGVVLNNKKMDNSNTIIITVQNKTNFDKNLQFFTISLQ